MNNMTHAIRIRELLQFLRRGPTADSSAAVALERMFNDEIDLQALRRQMRKSFDAFAQITKTQNLYKNPADPVPSDDTADKGTISNRPSIVHKHTSEILEHAKYTLALAWHFLQRRDHHPADFTRIAYCLSDLQYCRHIKLAFQAVLDNYDRGVLDSGLMLTCALCHRRDRKSVV